MAPRPLRECTRRQCRSLHHCCLCEKDITLGEFYYDGGWNRRAHIRCVEPADDTAEGRKG